MAYIQGQSRSQTSLFPVSLEELIPEDHLVRVIDTYVAKLDLVRLGFDKAFKPDFKTIADFRKNNTPAFIATCRAFVQFCRAVVDKRIAQYLAERDEADKNEANEVVDRSAVKTALAQLEVRHSNNLTYRRR